MGKPPGDPAELAGAKLKLAVQARRWTWSCKAIPKWSRPSTLRRRTQP